ncbi:PEP-utilizing enzyme [Nocardia alni]|uniref:PEP-utilizing enzyme n=1 Tax=Nocardia alni TaxID=2815723 RepID=UPI001C22B837|nr:PEP-utilizing enzyme [Nocardia alni]
MQARVAAERELLSAVPKLNRPTTRFMLRRAAGLTRKLELTKAAYLMALDGCRAAARDLGAQHVSDGRLADVEDVFFLTVAELEAMRDDSSVRVEDRIAYRRAQRAIYEELSLPTTFTGMPSATSEVTAAEYPDRRVLEGKASGGSRREGRARVLTDPDADADLEEGDILVCRFTDPSWTPLMMLASALVIDIGSQSSHGAVVARELGIPYVIGTDIGTRVIRDGDHLVVDGGANTVTIAHRRGQDRPFVRSESV